MALLSDLRGLLTRRKSPAVDLSSGSTSSISGKPSTAIETKLTVGAGGTSSGMKDMGRTASHAALNAGSAATIDEVMGLVRTISTHLEKQTSRTGRLVECLQRLPEALDAMPEINRQNARLLEVINDYLDHARRRDDALNDTLSGMSTASRRQTEVLGLLQQQMDVSHRTSETLVSSLGDFRETLTELAGSNSRASNILTELSRSNERREIDLTHLLDRNQRWLVAAVVCCATMSLTAIILAGVAWFG